MDRPCTLRIFVQAVRTARLCSAASTTPPGLLRRSRTRPFKVVAAEFFDRLLQLTARSVGSKLVTRMKPISGLEEKRAVHAGRITNSGFSVNCIRRALPGRRTMSRPSSDATAPETRSTARRQGGERDIVDGQNFVARRQARLCGRRSRQRPAARSHVPAKSTRSSEAFCSARSICLSCSNWPDRRRRSADPGAAASQGWLPHRWRLRC